MATSIGYLKGMLLDTDIKAVLRTIRRGEGTIAPDGYSYLFGSSPKNNRRFTDFSTHPNQRFTFTINGVTNITSAAGAYQILKKTFDTLCFKYGFKDFTPQTQDLMALALFDTRGCLKAVADGNFFDPEIMDRLNNEWASLPMAGYGQPEKSMDQVKRWYIMEGGIIAK